VGVNFYVNVASVGLSVEVTRHLSPRLKKSVAPLAYPIAVFVASFKHKLFAARLRFPRGDYDPAGYDQLLQIAIGNGGFYDGGMVVAPGSGIDDRNLDVYAIRLERRRDLIAVVRHLRSGEFVKLEGVDHFRTRRVQLETEPQLPVNVDGKLVTSTPQTFSVPSNVPP
jgi:diacylglycerol kinase (ATP)